MAKKKSFDFKQIGQFFFQKGERIGLAVSAVIMVLLVALGVMAGVSSQDWAKIINAEAESKMQQVHRAPADPALGTMSDKDKVQTVWAELDPKQIPGSVLWFNLDETQDNKRRNPIALAVIEREIQVDFLQGAYYAYEVDFNKTQFGAYVAAGAKQAGLMPARTIRPKRGMAVISAALPYKEQLELFRKALRFTSIEELRTKPEDMPKYLGLIVTRSEVLPNNQTAGDTVLFRYDEQRDKTIPAPHLDVTLKEAIYQTVPAELREFIHSGLVTPLPEMAVGTYPALDLPTIKAAAISPGAVAPGAGNMPKPGGNVGFPNIGFQPQPAGGNQANYTALPWTALQKPLQEKFAGKLNVFEPWDAGDSQKAVAPNVGILRPEGGATRPQIGENANVAGQEPPADGFDKILVRFFDVDLQPGKTYRYTIQVRLANPNFGRDKDVAFAALAREKEFVSPPVSTPTITVPPDFGYYAIDQTPDSKAAGNDTAKMTGDRAPVQIHRWTDKESGNLVGDWVVAERLLVRRGEAIGRSGVITEVAEWDAANERFEVGSTILRGKTSPGIPVDFRLDRLGPAPVLVDFMGGDRAEGYRDERLNGIYGVRDQSELEMLILAPNGKLIVRSSAVDSTEATPEGKERALHYNQWRDRLRMLRGGADDKKGPASIFPGNN